MSSGVSGGWRADTGRPRSRSLSLEPMESAARQAAAAVALASTAVNTSSYANGVGAGSAYGTASPRTSTSVSGGGGGDNSPSLRGRSPGPPANKASVSPQVRIQHSVRSRSRSPSPGSPRSGRRRAGSSDKLTIGSPGSERRRGSGAGGHSPVLLRAATRSKSRTSPQPEQFSGDSYSTVSSSRSTTPEDCVQKADEGEGTGSVDMGDSLQPEVRHPAFIPHLHSNRVAFTSVKMGPPSLAVEVTSIIQSDSALLRGSVDMPDGASAGVGGHARNGAVTLNAARYANPPAVPNGPVHLRFHRTAASTPELRPQFINAQAENAKMEDFDLRRDEVIGTGSFGVVFAATHKATQTDVVMKVLDKARSTSQRIYFRREVDALMRVQSRYIPKLFGAFEDPDNCYVAMERREGVDVFTFLETRPQFKLSEEEARFVSWQLVCALRHCHARGVVHRDIKLENILIKGETLETTLIDFGLCFVMPYEGALCHDFCGSLDYASPEIVRKERAYLGTRADVWSLGVVMFILLFGITPFNRKHRSRAIRNRLTHPSVLFPHDPKCEESALHLIERVLDIDPESRADISEVYTHPWFSRLRIQQEQQQQLFRR